VDHRGQRVRRRHRCQQPGERGAVGGVAGGDGGLGARCAQPADQLGGTRRGGAAAAGQHQVPHAVVGHQVLGQHAAQRPGPAGDQHRAARCEQAAFRVAGVHGRRTDQAGQVAAPAADRELGLPAGQRGRDGGHGGRVPVQVEQHQPVGLLPGGGPHQPPHRRAGQVGHVLVGAHRHRAPGLHD
jgi:hypothetical protein